MIAATLSRAVELAAVALPWALDAPLSQAAGTLAYLASPRARAAVSANLEVIAARARPGHELHARRVFVAQARNYIETFRILRLERRRLLEMVEVEGWANFAQAQARGRGVILASAHLGPVVLCGQILATPGHDVLVVVEPKSNDLGRLVDRARSAMGIRTLETTSALTIGRRLREGATIGFLADRPITGVGERVAFFGREALLPSAHVALALRTGAALVPAFALREGPRLVARIHPELALERTGDREADTRRGLERWSALLEAAVSSAPEQWSVFQRVWNGSR